MKIFNNFFKVLLGYLVIFFFLNKLKIPGIKETEVNEFMLIGLGLGISLLVMMSVFLMCHRNRKRRRLEHPMLPSHAHFHTCESIGERFATSSSMDSVSRSFRQFILKV
jgi:hypothetical protein